jgi:hypothetical protein
MRPKTRIRFLSSTTASTFVALLFCGLTSGSSLLRAQEDRSGDWPTFSVEGGVFTNAVTLSLWAKSQSASIRYTLDNSEPTAASPSYAAAIKITNSVLVRARVFEKGEPAGPVTSHAYVMADADMEGFHSNLPLVLINTFEKEVPKEEKLPASIRVIDTRSGRASVTGPADFDGRVLINLRGRASLRYAKRSYTLKTIDDVEEVIKASILGMPKESDWVLYGPYPDKTLMRDVLAYDLSNAIGRWAPRAKYVEVFLCETGAKLSRRDYLGVYVFEERVKRDKHRVDVENLSPADYSEPKITGGYVFKKDHNDNGDQGMMNIGGPAQQAASSTVRTGYPTGPGGFPGDPVGFQPPFRGTVRSSSSSSSSSSRSTRASRTAMVTNYLGAPTRREPTSSTRTMVRIDDDEYYEISEDETSREFFRTALRTNKFFYVDPEPDELTSVQRAWLQSHLNSFETVLYGPGFADASKGYASFIDRDSFIDYHLLVEMTKNVDGFRFSTFYHKERGGKIKAGPLWDWNLSFGNCNGKQGFQPEGWLWPQLDDREYSWYRRLFEDPDFAQRYVDRWAELRATVFATSNVLARVDAMAALLRGAQVRNFEKWPILGVTVSPNWYVGDTYAEEVNWMKEWISNRLAWIEKQFLRPPGIESSAGKFTLTAPDGKILFTVDGSDPRSPGGAPSPNSRTYDQPVAGQGIKALVARVQHNNRWSAPVRMEPSLQ